MLASDVLPSRQIFSSTTRGQIEDSGRRSFPAVGISLALHAVMLAGVALLGRQAVSSARPADSGPIVYVSLRPAERVPPRVTPIEAPRLERVAPLPPIAREPAVPVAVELPKPVPAEVAPAPLNVRRADPADVQSPARRGPPVVTVGAFGSATADAGGPRAEERRQTRAADFDAPVAAPPLSSSRATAVGGFDTSLPATGQTGPAAAVATAGFDRQTDTGPLRGANRSVASAGFGDGAAATGVPGGSATRSGSGSRPGAGGVRQGGFEVVRAATPPARPQPLAQRIDTSVEILFKPTPVYTPEALALKLEGEVSLEVEFLASGEARVIRVVTGLGRGLDEAAAHAAERIRFKPAQAAGVPVTFRSIVRIVFRLS